MLLGAEGSAATAISNRLRAVRHSPLAVTASSRTFRSDALQVRDGQSARAERRFSLGSTAPAQYKTDYPLRIKFNPVSCVPRHGLGHSRALFVNGQHLVSLVINIFLQESKKGYEYAANRIVDSKRFALGSKRIGVASYTARPLARVGAAVSCQPSFRVVAFAA